LCSCVDIEKGKEYCDVDISDDKELSFKKGPLYIWCDVKHLASYRR
jgi:hypothetical protein